MRKILLIICLICGVTGAWGQEAFYDCFDAIYSQRGEFGKLTEPINSDLDSCFDGGYFYVLDFYDPSVSGRATSARGIAIGDFDKDTTKAILMKMEGGRMTYDLKSLSWDFASDFKNVYDIISTTYNPFYPSGSFIYDTEDYRGTGAHFICVVDESKSRFYNIHLGNYHFFMKGSLFRSLYIMSTVVRLRLEDGTIDKKIKR